MTLDEFILDHIQHEGYVTLRKPWRFITSDVYRSVWRLWRQGKVTIDITLKVTATVEH